MTIENLTTVWSPISALLAIMAGTAYGVAAGRIATNPAYSAGIASPIRTAVITSIFAASGGLIFFAAQSLGSYLSNDPNWSRVMSRYGQWFLFSIAIGVTTWILVRRDRDARHRRAREIIASELGQR